MPGTLARRLTRGLEWVDDHDRLEALACVHIFRVEPVASGLNGGLDHHRIPERQLRTLLELGRLHEKTSRVLDDSPRQIFAHGVQGLRGAQGFFSFRVTVT